MLSLLLIDDSLCEVRRHPNVSCQYDLVIAMKTDIIRLHKCFAILLDSDERLSAFYLVLNFIAAKILRYRELA